MTSQIATVESTLSNTIAENSLLISNLDTEVDTKANQTDLDSLSNLVGTTSVQSQISSAIADLVDSAPETLDTLSELATAIQENQTVVDTLDAAITNKADKADLEATKNEVDEIQTQLNDMNIFVVPESITDIESLYVWLKEKASQNISGTNNGHPFSSFHILFKKVQQITMTLEYSLGLGNLYGYRHTDYSSSNWGQSGILNGIRNIKITPHFT